MASLWATEGAFRLLTLVYALFIHTDAVRHYTHPHAASCFIAVECIWSGFVAYALYARPSWRRGLVMADVVITAALVYVTWWVAPQSWWDHNQSLPTTMWVTNAVLCAGMAWGVWAGFVAGVGLSLASLHVGGDLGWMVHSPTMPILVSAGIAAGVGGRNTRRAHAQLSEALQLRARAIERERLAREVHDGVLQVLALTARTGARVGGEVAQLGALAAEQEKALRRLIADRDETLDDELAADHAPVTALPDHRADEGAAYVDVRRALLAFADDGCRVSVGADPVMVTAAPARELLAAVRQAAVNARLHAGEGAGIFVLLEDLGGQVVVTVRDDGVGIAPGRLEEAREAGHLGVSSSIRGRMRDAGGTAHLVTAPGEGTEWEFSLPR